MKQPISTTVSFYKQNHNTFYKTLDENILKQIDNIKNSVKLDNV